MCYPNLAYSIGLPLLTIQVFLRKWQYCSMLSWLATSSTFEKIIFQKIVEEAGSPSTNAHLGYQILITQFMLQQAICQEKGEMVSNMEKVEVITQAFYFWEDNRFASWESISRFSTISIYICSWSIQYQHWWRMWNTSDRSVRWYGEMTMSPLYGADRNCQIEIKHSSEPGRP